MSVFSHGKLITVLQYFTDKIDDYWHILYPVVTQSSRIEDPYLYFYDISRKATDYKGQFNNDGIYLFKGYDKQWHLHALELSQYSLACWLAWVKTSGDVWLQKAIKHCVWLVQNQEKDGAWRTEHKNPLYRDLPTPWASALTQGLAISSLIRAYYYTNENRFLESAKKACDFLEVDVEQNGVRRDFKKNGIKGFVYEEYPRNELNGALNGYISAILAIKELSVIDMDYWQLLEKNLKNLKNILNLYDTGYYSYYALDGNVSSGFYHRLIVKQLEVLSGIDSDFSQYFKIFLDYQNSFINASRALSEKIKFNI